jgi:hypothetical protein
VTHAGSLFPCLVSWILTTMYRSAAVGRGAGQVFKGAGKGVGHVLGGGK